MVYACFFFEKSASTFAECFECLIAEKSFKRRGVAAKCCLTRGKYMLIEFQQKAALYFRSCSSCVLVQ